MYCGILILLNLFNYFKVNPCTPNCIKQIWKNVVYSDALPHKLFSKLNSFFIKMKETKRDVAKQNHINC